MDAPAATDLVRLRADLRTTGLLLLGAAAALIVVAAGLGHTSGAWAAWAAATYVSWAVALTVLLRRRLARAARAARRLPGGVAGEERLRPTRGRVLWVLTLAGFLVVVVATGATDIGAGATAAAASVGLAAARWAERLEGVLGGAIYFDRRGRLRGWGPADARNLWLATPPTS